MEWWNRLTKSEKTDLKNALLAGGISIVLFLITPYHPALLAFVVKTLGAQFALPFRFATLVLITILLFGLLQFFRYWHLWSLKQAILHNIKILLSISPIVWVTLAILGLWLFSLFVVCTKYAVVLSDESLIARTPIKAVAATFYVFSIPMILIVITGGWWFSKHRAKREKTIVEVMGNTTGLVPATTSDDKDPEIRERLYTLENCHFIFLQAIHFSQIIGEENSDFKKNIKELLEKNPDGKVFVQLQCPFCKDVINRAIELDIPYDEKYIKSSIESVSNCLSADSDKVTVVLVHGRPFIRCVLWGQFKKDSPYECMDIADRHGDRTDHQEKCQEYMKFVTGGFTLQEYSRGKHGCSSELYEGSTVTHGGLWNELRRNFVYLFSKGINPNYSLEQLKGETLKHLAWDLGMSKLRAYYWPWTTENGLREFVSKNEDFTGYISRIHERAKVKRKKQ